MAASRIPTSALDRPTSDRLAETFHQLCKEKNLAIVIVTHAMQQAARVSDVTAFLYLGKLVEVGFTDALFTNPKLKQTEDYITGRYG